MGVKGLLPGLQESAKASSVGYFKGTRVAIDASGWLHKGLYAAAEDYVDSGRMRCLHIMVSGILSEAQAELSRAPTLQSVNRCLEPSYEPVYH